MMFEAEKRRISASYFTLAHCGVGVPHLIRSGSYFLNCLLLSINPANDTEKLRISTSSIALAHCGMFNQFQVRESDRQSSLQNPFLPPLLLRQKPSKVFDRWLQRFPCAKILERSLSTSLSFCFNYDGYNLYIYFWFETFLMFSTWGRSRRAHSEPAPSIAYASAKTLQGFWSPSTATPLRRGSCRALRDLPHFHDIVLHIFCRSLLAL